MAIYTTADEQRMPMPAFGRRAASGKK